MASQRQGGGEIAKQAERMPRCQRCGATGVARLAAGSPVFCCAGCALAVRVPKDAEGNFPANAALGVALGVGLLAFNQVLLASLVWTTAGGADRWRAASWILGLVAALVLFATHWRVGAGRAAELLVGAAVAIGWTLAIRTSSVGLGLAITGAYILWSLRGLLRAVKRSGDPI